MKIEAIFEVSLFTTIKDTFVDNVMIFEFDAPDIDSASYLAFAKFIQSFLIDSPPNNMPVIRSIELIRMEDEKGYWKHYKNDIEDEDEY
jgi:hypothetical protein